MSSPAPPFTIIEFESKKKWQNMFLKIIRKKRIKSVPHNFKHITPNITSPEKIAHVLALVEEKINLVKQVKKWKQIAKKFHDESCSKDYSPCCEPFRL